MPGLAPCLVSSVQALSLVLTLSLVLGDTTMPKPQSQQGTGETYRAVPQIQLVLLRTANTFPTQLSNPVPYLLPALTMGRS